MHRAGCYETHAPVHTHQHPYILSNHTHRSKQRGRQRSDSVRHERGVPQTTVEGAMVVCRGQPNRVDT